MLNRVRLVIPLLLLLGLLATTAATTAESPNRKIVVFRAGVDVAAQHGAVRAAGGKPLKSLGLVNATVAELAPGAEVALAHRPDVVRVEDDVLVYALEPAAPPLVEPEAKPDRGNASKRKPTPTPTPSPTPTVEPSPAPTLDPSPTPTPTLEPSPTPTPTVSPTPTTTPIPSAQPIPWGVGRIGAPEAWETSIGTGVKVAVIDTGISTSHPDLRVTGGVNTIISGGSYDDDNGHGSHVAGIIAALDNAQGVVGVGPGIDLYAVKVLSASGSGYLSDIIEGLDWAIANKMQVANMSLGTSSNVQSFQDAIIKAYNAGITLVAAAGNSGPAKNSVNYPGAYPEVIAVSAIDSSNAIARWSSRGPEVDLAAPGVSIYSTYKGTGYTTLSGTSMASPHVAGVAALWLKKHGYNAPSSGLPNTVTSVLKGNTEDLGLDATLQGAGLVRADWVVDN